jgi:serine/threonine protein kinase/Tol biopolymer transport system component
MTPERWAQVNEVLHQAMRLAEVERADYLDHACAADSDLRREVESLLAADEQARSSFLQSAPLGLIQGTRLGDYDVLAKLGAGGMGEVYRALDVRLRREVAIKVLPGFASSDPERLRRFEQEAMATAALNHPNILAVYQMGTHEGAPYLVSELLEGETLRDQVKHGKLPLRKAIDFGIQIAHGLAAAHEKGIVHRDLKPENLFVTKDGRAKILDFGLAKLQQPHSASVHSALTLASETEPGVVMGTAGYMSPEQVRGQPTDHRADIFAFGTILYEMLTGQRAFQKPTSAETMAAILNEEPSPISQVNLQIPPGLERVVRRCLEKNPERRFQSTSDLAFALEALSDAGSASTTATRSRTLLRRIGVITRVGVLATIVTVVILLAWRLTRQPAIPVVEAVTQLTDDGEEKSGGLQTDGTRIYANEGSYGSEKIVEFSVNGGQAAELPTPLVSPDIVDISKDHSALLVLVGNTFRQTSSMWLVPIPAGTPRQLGDGAVWGGASLFPDGRVIYTNGSVVYVAGNDGSKPYKLAELPQFTIGEPRTSPDGRRVVFDTSEPNRVEWTGIYEMSSEGKGLHQIAAAGQGELGSVVCCAQWTPDGRYLIFRTKSSWRWDLWILPQNTITNVAKPVRLTNGPISYSTPVISPDGQVFAKGSKRRGELVRYDSKTGHLVSYLGGISAFDITFSRDGKWAAYLSYPEHTLWRSRADGSDRRQLTFPPEEVFFPRISPDGSRVSFSTVNYEGFTISISGGKPEKLTDNAVNINWSPDGNRLTFTSPVPGKSPGQGDDVELRLMDLRTGSISVVPGSQGKLGSHFVSQNELVAATEDTAKFALFDLRTEKWSELFATADTFRAWKESPDGRYLYFATAGKDPKIVRIHFADHRVETIMNLKDVRPIDDSIEGQVVDATPDNSVIFTRDVGTQEIYALQLKWP